MDKTDIFTGAIKAAKRGSRVIVSLVERSVTVDGCMVIDRGRWEGDLGVAVVDEAAALAMIEDAYAAYERSVPEHDGNDRSRWFYACDEDRLTDRDLVLGEDRPVARCRLELLTLALILNGSLTVDGPRLRGKWFWQSDRYPDLVILTEWIKN